MIKELRGLALGEGLHLILGRTLHDVDWAALRVWDAAYAIDPTSMWDDYVQTRHGHHMHWSEIQESMGKLHKRRQIFVATLNTFVVDCVGFESAQDAQARMLFADVKSRSLSRMTEEQAGRFYRAYQVGIQHVSEILRVEGIW